MNDWKHFALTCMILVGGPLLAVNHPEFKDFALGACTTVLGVWFGSKAKLATPGE